MTSEKRMPVEQRLGGWVPPEVGPVDLTAAERQRMWQRGTARRRRRQALQAGVAACAVLAVTVPLATGLVGPGQDQGASTTYDEYWPAELPSVLGGVPVDADVTSQVLRPGPVLAVAEGFPDAVATTGEDAGVQGRVPLWALSKHGTEFGFLDVPDFGSMPALSPHGTQIAYWAVAAAGEDDGTLVVVDLATGERREQQIAANGGVFAESLWWADESTLISTHGRGPDSAPSVWAWDLDDNRGVVPWGLPGAVNPVPTLLDSAELVVQDGVSGWYLVDTAGGNSRLGMVEELSRTLASQGQWVVVSPEGVAVENGPDSPEDAQRKGTVAQQIRVSNLAPVPPGAAAYGVAADSVLLDADHAIRGYIGFHGDDALAWGSEVIADDEEFDFGALFDGVVRIDTETGRSTEWVRVKAGSDEQPAMWQFAPVLLADAELVKSDGPGAGSDDGAAAWAVPVSVTAGMIALGGGAVLFVRRRRERF